MKRSEAERMLERLAEGYGRTIVMDGMHYRAALNGIRTSAGLPVADGQYSYRLVVRDEAGRLLDSPTRRVTISTAGPQGDVPITVNP